MTSIGMHSERKMVSSICFWLLLISACAQAEKVLRVEFSTILQAKEFQRYAMEKNLDIWSLRNTSADVAVSSAAEEDVKKTFPTKEIISNVERAVEKEMKENKNVERFNRRFRSFAAPIDYFPRYNVIVSWLSRLAATHSFVSVQSIGSTYEGRDMKVLRIGIGSETKPAVFIMGGIHAREWLSTATTLYMINKIVTGILSGDDRITALLTKYDFYFSPASNPDGYEYSHINPFTRSWRKTRSKQANGCYGADPNRNFDVNFGRKAASMDPCNIIYPGPYAFSERCTQNLRDFALSSAIRGRIKLFYDIHAYSQMYFVPFAFTLRKPSDDFELRRIAQISNKALMRINNRRFIIGTPGEILYEASGSTMDWFKLYAGVKFSYAFELFPNQFSTIGFLARPGDIRPSGEEISEAIFTAAEII